MNWIMQLKEFWIEKIKDGYSGVSTTLELGYAMALGKVIYALSEDKEEGCRNVLFREIIKTPEELIKKLG